MQGDILIADNDNLHKYLYCSQEHLLYINVLVNYIKIFANKYEFVK
jgi:hypothetical protein